MESDSPVSTRAKSALTSQDHLARRSARNSRVHFDEDDPFHPHLQEVNPILVQVVGEERSKTIGVYLGFLQEEHKYICTFTIPSSMVENYLTNSPPQGQVQIKLQLGDNSPNANFSGPSPTNSSEANGKSPETSGDQPNVCKLSDNLEVFGKGELCNVTEMEWSKGKPGGLLVRLVVTVPSTKAQHVLEDTFSIRNIQVVDRFVRVNIAAKIMGTTIGTPTLKDGIKCIGVCPTINSSDSDNSDNEVDMKDVPSS